MLTFSLAIKLYDDCTRLVGSADKANVVSITYGIRPSSNYIYAKQVINNNGTDDENAS